MQKFLLIILIPINLLSITPQTHAEINLDGTLGRNGALKGPEYLIQADFGKQQGGNLFHSFQEFNLQSHESATFSGPNSVQNVISRVTGGNPSNIDGLIRSTISNADMYFLNPYGIIFGPNARLDVQGSFHASTADYLRLEDGGRFDARYPNNSILTVAPIEAFGFLNSPIAPISVQGHGEVTPDWGNQSTGLNVPSGKTLSLIGGDIEIWKGAFFKTQTLDDEGNENVETTYLNSLHAPGGRINLAGVASQGEVKLKEEFIDVSSFTQLANISITDQSLLEISGKGAGNLFISGRDIVFKDSRIIAKSFGDRDNGMINFHSNGSILFQNGSQLETETTGKGQGTSLKFEAAETIGFSGTNINGTTSRIYQSTLSKKEGAGNGGTLFIKAKNIYLDGAEIKFMTYGKGNAGNMTISVEEMFSLTGHNPVSLNGSELRNSPSSTSNGGNAGSIVVEARDILFAEGSYISGTAFGPGNGADVTVLATGVITLTGVNKQGYESGIFSQTLPLPLYTSEAKNAGNIIVEAGELFLEGGAKISNSTVAPPGTKSGKGGHITVRAEKIDISGINVHGENSDGFGSGIIVSSRNTGGHAGDAGNIIIEADSLSITEGGVITSETTGKGEGGQIIININGPINIAGDSSKIERKAPLSSQIRFQSRELFWPTEESISGIYANSKGTTDQAGNSGIIELKAGQLNLKDGGRIGASTDGPGKGGHIIIKVTDSTTLSGKKSADGKSSQITSSSKGQMANAGDAGTIALETSKLSLTDGATITVLSSGSGQGGDLKITASRMNVTEGSRISASSSGDGHAGHIVLHIGDKLYLKNGGAITTETTHADGGNIDITSPGYFYLINSNITTSVGAEKGNGGNITLSPSFIVQDNSKIIARAVGGNGGNIDITTTGIYKFPPKSKSPIDASSKFGVDGVVAVNTPDSSADESLFALSTTLFDASTLMDTPCDQRAAENLSRFWLMPSEGASNAVNDLLPSGPLLSQIKGIKQVSSYPKEIKIQQYLTLTGCRPKVAMKNEVRSYQKQKNQVISDDLLFSYN